MKAINKILGLLILSFTVAICGLVATVTTPKAKAESVVSLNVEAKNVSYSDSVYIMYAVSVEGFDFKEQTVKMLFWDELQEEYAIGTEKYQVTTKKTTTVNGKTCLVFYSNGLAAKQMTDNVYSRACVVIDETVYYSDVEKYSVLEYASLMLERDSDSNQENDLSVEQKNLFNALLEYGGAAQELFNYNTDRLANDTYYKVEVVNGLLPDGFRSGRYKEGESVVITANEPISEEYEFLHWADEYNNVVSTEVVYEFTVEQESVKYIAVYENMTSPWKDKDNVFPFPLEWAGIDVSELLSSSNYIEGKKQAIPFAQSFASTFAQTNQQTEGEINLNIKAKNVSYSDSVYIMYAVSSAGFDYQQKTVKMLFWKQTQDDYVLGTESYQATTNKTTTVGGEKCLVFYSNGISAKQMTDNIYARACVVIDGVTYYSAVEKFSVLDYTCLMFERDGDDDTTNDLSNAQRNLFNALLNYGSAAQELFNYNINRLANDTYYKLEVEGGLISDGFNSGRYVAGEKVLITADAPAEGLKFAGWQDANGNIVSKSSSYELTVANANAKYTATYTEKTKIGNVALEGDEIAYNGDVAQILPNTITFDYDGETVELAVTWAVDSFNSQTIGEQTVYATLVDSSAYAEYGVGDISMSVSVLPYSVELDSATEKYVLTNYFTNESSIIIPSSYKGVDIIAIGDRVFENNKTLTNVALPSTITKIGDYAFYGCSALVGIDFPESLAVVGNSAFEGCVLIEQISIPSNLLSIGERAFVGCNNLQEIIVASDNANYLAIDGNLYSINATTLIQYAVAKPQTTFEIPEQVTSISAGAFYNCSALTEILIKSNILTIGEEVFSGCSNLTTIYCEATEKPQGWSNDWNANCSAQIVWGYHKHIEVVDQAVAPTCTKTGLTEGSHCSICEAVIVEQKVVDALGHNYKVASSNNNGTHLAVCQNDNAHTITANCEYDYVSNNDGTKEGYCECGHYNLTIDENVLTVENNVLVGVTEYGKTLTKLVILEDIKQINKGAFIGCNSLQEIVVAEGHTNFVAIDGNLYSIDATTLIQYAVAKPQTTFEIPEQVTSISAYAFYNCSALTEILISENIVNMGEEVFSGCSSLTDIYCKANERPQGWASDWNEGCSARVEWGFADTNGVEYTLVNNREYSVTAYTGESTEVVIFAEYKGKAVTSIGLNAFNGLAITSIEIPASINKIDNGAFNGCTALTKVNFLGTMDQWVQITFGNAYSNPTRNSKALYVNDELVTEVKLTNATKISPQAFYQIETITSIEIANTVTTIGDYAFRFCKGLKSIVIPDSVTYLGQYAFDGCTALETVVLSNNLTSLESHLFQGCSALTTIEIPRSVTNLSDLVFYNTSSLTSLYIPSSVVTMGAGKTNGVIRGASTALVIYCEADSIPSGWATKWNYNTRTVVWGYGTRINQAIDAINAIGNVTLKDSSIAEKVSTARALYEAIDLDIARNQVTNYEILVQAEQELSIITTEVMAWKNKVDAITIGSKITSANIEAINLVQEIYTGWLNSADALLRQLATDLVQTGSTYSYTKYVSLIASRDALIADIDILAQEMQALKTDTYEISLDPIAFNNAVTSVENKYLALDSSVITKYFTNGSDELYSAQQNYLTALNLYNNVYRFIGDIVELGDPTKLVLAHYEIVYALIEEYDALSDTYKYIVIEGGFKQRLDTAKATVDELKLLNDDGFVYELINNNKEYAIKQFKGSALDVVVPNEYLGKPITSIKANAFLYCVGLTSIELPNSITSISFGALNGCTTLQKLVIPFVGASSSDVNNAYIGYLFGLECPTEEQPTHLDGIPKTLKEIIVTGNTKLGTGAFAYCTSLEKLEIAEGVTQAGYGAFAYNDKLVQVKLPQSLVTFGYGAFAYCTSLTSITLSSSTTAIGEAMFTACSSLTSISMPSTVASIGDYAFGGCESLSSVTIGSNVTSIGFGAFAYCSSLTSISIPSKVTSIGEYAFIQCSKLTTVTLGSALKTIGWGAFSECHKLEKVTMSNNVVSIGEYVFYDCVSLNSINLSTSLTSIGEYAFYNCSSLTSIKIPKTVTYIGYRAFTYCLSLTIYCVASTEPPIHTVTSTSVSEFTGVEITTVTEYPWNTTNCPVVLNCESNSVASNNNAYVTVNGIKYAIQGSTAIVVRQPSTITSANIASSVTYSGKSYSVTAIDARAFYGCKAITSVTIPSTITSIGDYAFYNCDLLTSVSIPSSVTSIGKYAFSQSDALKTVTIPSTIASIGSHAFRGCKLLTYTVSGGLKYLGNSSNPYLYLAELEENTNITEVTINSNCRIVGSYIFTNANSLTNVTIPSTVVYMGHEVFYNCTSLTIYCIATSTPSGWESDWNYAKNPVVWNSNNNDVADDGYVYTVVNGIRYAIKDDIASVAKQSNGLTQANILESITINSKTYAVTSILEEAFYNCKKLKVVSIPNSVEYIGQKAFSGCSSLEYTEIDYLYLGNDENPYLYLAGVTSKSITEVSISSDTRFIGDSAFASCESLSVITIPASIKTIGANAFSKCYSLYNVTFEEGSVLTSIGSGAFSNTSVGTIKLPSTVTSISNAFESATALTSITLTSNITSIDNFAFQGAYKLKSITIPSSIKNIGMYAFAGCSALTTVTISSDITNIGEGAFSECTSLAKITIPNTVTTIGSYAFDNCNSLTTVSLSTKLTAISSYTFRGCAKLASITIPNSVISIGAYAFENCSSLATVTFASNSQLKTISQYAFSYCTSLTSITMPSSLTSLGSYSFSYCSSLAEVTLNEGLVTMGQQIFIYCDSLTELRIPSTVTTIGYGICAGCANFTKFYRYIYASTTNWNGSWHWSGTNGFNVSYYW